MKADRAVVPDGGNLKREFAGYFVSANGEVCYLLLNERCYFELNV
jgi:hypothetical protein